MQPQDQQPRRPITNNPPERGQYIPVDRFRQPTQPARPMSPQPEPQRTSVPQPQPIRTPQPTTPVVRPVVQTPQRQLQPTAVKRKRHIPVRGAIMTAVIAAIIIAGGLIFSAASKKGASVANEKEAITQTKLLWADVGQIPATGDSQLDAQNKQRQQALDALQTQVEAYFTAHNYYPTAAEMGSVSWMAANLRDFNAGNLKDPTGKLSVLTNAPKKGQYSYQAGTDNTLQSCDNVQFNCNYYALSAVMSDGSTYTKVAQR